MHKPFSVQTWKHMLVASLSVLLVTSMFVALPFLVAEPVFASPSPVISTDLFYSQPTAQTISPTSPAWVTNATRARDKDNSTFAQFNYGLQATTNSYFEVKTFKTPTVKAAPYPVIHQVDLKMRYEAEANTQGETYKIDYYVSPSTALQPLQVPTGAAFGPDTQVWSARSEPNDGVWNWTDIGNIKIRVTVSGTQGSTMSSLFKEYEAWATVVIVSSPRLFVNPANITDASKGIGSVFTVDVKLENISSSAGVEFRFRYDPEILNITSTTPVEPASPAEDQALPAGFIYSTGTIWAYSVDRIKGIFYVSYTAGPLASPPPPTFGSGKIATISFQVLGLGETTLHIYDTIMGAPGGFIEIPHDLIDGYFRNAAMPYGATLKIFAPSTPVSGPFTTQINISKPSGQSGAFGVYSWEFNATYDKTVINATSVFEGDFLRTTGATTFKQTIDRINGWVWANSTLNGDMPGAWGSGTIATINFGIVGGGTSSIGFIPSEVSLTRIDYGAGPPSPKYSLPVNPINGQVVVGLPVANFTFSPNEPKVHDMVTFDASASYDPDGTIVSYAWDFGDTSTGSGMIVAHAYNSKGVFTIRLNVTDNNGFKATSEKTVTVSGTPVAAFTYSPLIPSVSQIVTFNASGSFDPDGHIVSYAWNFGDGTRQIFVGANLTDIATHIYTSKGLFTVTLTVTDNDTLVSNPFPRTVNIGGVPVPSFTYSPTEPKVGQTVNFDASASYDPNGNITSYSWDFGDGTREIFIDANLTQTATHAYGTDATYMVNLTLTDNDGNSQSTAQTLTVKPLVHDVAVTSVTANPTLVKRGHNVTINVGVRNLGDAAETIDVNVYFDSALAAPKQTVVLAGGSNGFLTFIWNTTGVAKGMYEMKANATQVPAEVDISNNQMTASQLVWVSLPPIATFTYSPPEPKVNEVVTFNATASYDPDGTIAYYFWDFGDTSEGVGKEVTHNYTNAGTYYVNLTVRDDYALLDSEVQLISVDKKASTITVTPTPSTTAVGGSVTLNGLITPKRTGASVMIYHRLQGATQWIQLASKTTDADGKYAQDWTPTKVGVYELIANWTGDAETLPAQSAVAILTVNKVSSEISISLSVSSLDLGSAVTISGSITPKRVSTSVTIQYKIGSGTWTNITSVITGVDGGYNHNWTPVTAGDYELRVIWSGDANTEPDTSVTRTLRVETPQDFAIPWYALVGVIIALVAVVGLVVYFKKFRKR